MAEVNISTNDTFILLSLAISIAWLSLKYMFYKLINDTAMERRVMIDVYDFVAVLFLVVFFTQFIDLFESYALTLVGYGSFDSIKDYIVGSSLEVIPRLTTYKDQLSTTVDVFGWIINFQLGIESLITLSPSFIPSLVQKYSEALSMYVFIDKLILYIRIGAEALKYMLSLGPTLIYIGIAVRGLPMCRAPSGFLIALGFGLTYIYPLTYVALFSTPSIPPTEAVRRPTFCGFSSMFTTSGSFVAPPLFNSLPSQSLSTNNLVSFLSDLYLNLIVRHIISLSITLIFIRMASMILANNLVLTYALEGKLGDIICGRL